MTILTEDAGNFAIRLIISMLFFTGFIANTVYVIIASQSGTGLEKVFSVPWTLAAFFDYVAGTPLSCAYLWTISPNFIVGLVFSVILNLFLGNLFTFLVLGYVVLTTLPRSKPIRNVIFCAREDDSLPGKSKIALNVYQVYSFICLVVFLVFFIKAIFEQSLSDGYKEVTSDPWSFATFVDAMCGISFNAFYVVLREGNRWWISVPLAFSIILLGNGVSIVYLLFTSFNYPTLTDFIMQTDVLSKEDKE